MKLRKIDEATFNVSSKQTSMKSKNCNPSVVVLNGKKVQVSDQYRTLVPRGMYRHIVFIPDELLGEVRWTRVFASRKMQYDQVTVDTGMVFLFEPIV